MSRFAQVLACCFAISTIGAADPPAKPKPEKVESKFTDPKSTYRAYIDAVRRNDLKGAKECWVIDDNKSGALDIIAGIWISMRQLNQMVVTKFGKDAAKAIPEGWRRPAASDSALNLTEKRLDESDAKITGDVAELRIKWHDDDGGDRPAFFFTPEGIQFRKVNGNWKIDANKMTGLKHGADFFEKGTWGPMFRDQVVIANEAVDGLEKGELKTAQDLKAFIEDKMSTMQKKYEEERRKPDGKRR